MSSSTEKNGFSVSKGRLNGAASWRPDDDNQNQWLQVDLGKKELVTAIATQGSGSNRYWLKNYSITYGVDKENLTSYNINATQKVFAGNYDKNSVVTNLLYPAINARYIRIHPLHFCISYDEGFCNTSEVPFGVEDGRIKNSQMTSSTAKLSEFSASKGRLNGTDSWRPTNDDQKQWLQVDLVKKELVTAIATQGSGSNRYWVKTYSISYGVDKEKLTLYKINVTQKVFAGNYDKNSVVTNLLYPAINARYIRIHPVSWFNRISMRIEVICCYTGYWRPANKKQNQWLQVDLGNQEFVTAIATQGSGRSYWVETYSISYGVDKANLTSYKIYATQKVFDGNMEGNSVVTNVLSPAVTARYIRIHPRTWNNHISLRVELYCCQRAGEKTLGVEDKSKVKASQLTSSSYLNAWTKAARGRLHNNGQWRAGWRAGANDKNQWIQVDLSKKEVVSGIATQGGYYCYPHFCYYRWVKTYYVKHSLNGTTFESYKDEGDDKIKHL
ncbi:lactadherin-like [Dendronephthya gigantea]|uniref:lactadherin-like n=1 Tax=Dendronephthya gigantea TaxID=151771 RepID=UPI00106B0856|nr:lactadherin-like [Dendronephthya gigantea]